LRNFNSTLCFSFQVGVFFAISLNPNNYIAMYNMACLYSINKNSTEACKWLKTSVEKGNYNLKRIKEDKNFDNIRNSSCYKDIMKEK